LAAEGATVVISDVNYSVATQTAKEIERVFNIKTRSIKTDVRKKEDIQNLVEFVISDFGHIDILVNNAGICYQTKVEDIGEGEWDEVMDINLKGVFFCSQAVTSIMKKQHQGRILNIASLAGKVGGLAAGAHYAASKAGVICLTKVFARELAPFGVTVNAIAPGFVNTALTQAFPPEVIKSYEMTCPLGTLAEPEDVAEAAIFLLSDGAKHITGEILDVNGGILMD
jgi:3-oxoacyl-[acyl-carrier protein] reductase